ncbi:MAG: hypothetical protein H6656_10200 [Ardenticatenaceae bacterium]|nr:hypothetical protein [Ardenticatenaceae bacterium]
MQDEARPSFVTRLKPKLGCWAGQRQFGRRFGCAHFVKEYLLAGAGRVGHFSGWGSGRKPEPSGSQAALVNLAQRSTLVVPAQFR